MRDLAASKFLSYIFRSTAAFAVATEVSVASYKPVQYTVGHQNMASSFLITRACRAPPLWTYALRRGGRLRISNSTQSNSVQLRSPQLAQRSPGRSFAGHSKWHNIRNRKGAQDAKRAKAFVKLSAEIASASRACGGDTANARLAQAISKARQANMPKSNVDSAVERGASPKGALGEMCRYEGTGPGSVSIIVEALTDNRNRTGGQIRHLFSKFGGNLLQDGAVSWSFQRVGLIELRQEDEEVADGDVVGYLGRRGRWEETILNESIDLGAHDVDFFNESEGDDSAAPVVARVVCSSSDVAAVTAALEAKGLPPTSAELAWVPKDGEEGVAVPAESEEDFAALLLAFEDNEDVMAVHHNAK